MKKIATAITIGFFVTFIVTCLYFAAKRPRVLKFEGVPNKTQCAWPQKWTR